MEVCHSCDVPGCVRPEHLFLGTHQENMRDMCAKGRHNKPKGQDSGRALLTDAQVLAMRLAYARGGTSYTVLAKQYGVGKTTVEAIIRRKTWGHI